MLSDRASSAEPSATLAINAKVKEMAAKGINVIDLGAGEPDFNTPEHIKEAAKAAIDKNFTRYTPVPGTNELRDAVASRIGRIRQEVLISPGAKYSLYLAMQALLNPGDEIIVPSPYWVSYLEQAKLAGAVPVVTETEEFQLDAEKLKECVTEKTKIILINSPCKPTGAVFSKKAIEAVADIADDKDIFIISDEIYEKFIYGVEHFSIDSLIPERTIVVNGVSKTYAMTGWRIGYASGPKEIIAAMSDIQSQTTSNPCSIAQAAALAALTGPQDSVQQMVKEFDRRRRYAMKRLSGLGMPYIEPKGAFYIFPDTSSLGTSMEVTKKLLDEAHIAVVPGAAFGSDEHIRISYATSMNNLEKAFDRIEILHSTSLYD
ncbi:MAG: pyridoxal phosphate-dependent aminotransferase [Candidatus Aenigmarchaeota archaeon]|nr:pyridoxal phosphate-dependent aminotransferase [Candidatus Aenigmarchaeota archaeon]